MRIHGCRSTSFAVLIYLTGMVENPNKIIFLLGLIDLNKYAHFVLRFLHAVKILPALEDSSRIMLLSVPGLLNKYGVSKNYGYTRSHL